MNRHHCLAGCANWRREGQYLCRSCWQRLTPTTRARLNRRDDEARNRLFQLLSAIRRGVALTDIEVAA